MAEDRDGAARSSVTLVMPPQQVGKSIADGVIYTEATAAGGRRDPHLDPRIGRGAYGDPAVREGREENRLGRAGAARGALGAGDEDQPPRGPPRGGEGRGPLERG